MLVFSGGRKTGVPAKKPSDKEGTKNKLNRNMALGRTGTQATLLGGEGFRLCTVPVHVKRRLSTTNINLKMFSSSL